MDNQTWFDATLVYIQGVTETIKRILNSHNVKVAQKPFQTLGHIFAKPKDPVTKEQRTDAIYSIPCNDCDNEYIGQTKRQFGTRLKDHPKEVFFYKKENSALSGHTCLTNDTIGSITGLWSHFPLMIPNHNLMATASYKRRSHIYYFPMWSRYHYRHSHGVTTLQIFIPVITPLTLDLFSAIFSRFCNQMYLINTWNRVQLTCLPAGSLDAHQWTSRFAVKNKIGIEREQSIYFIWCVY